MSKWHETSCADCGNTFHYHEDWDRIPDLCKDCKAERRARCAKWHEKHCECGNVIRYHEEWDRTPDLCKSCVAAKKANWHEKSCVCGKTFRYHEDWDRIPDLCKDCVHKKREARAKWHEKSCDCGNTIRFHEDWNNIPSRCKECNTWQTKPCAAHDCSGEVRYKRFWSRVPEYCPACKKGDRRITVRQRKGDGSTHEYTGRGYVNRQGAAVFSDNTGDGKHSHKVTNADGSERGRRDEGFDESWVDSAVNTTHKTTRHPSGVKHNRFVTRYRDRRTKKHSHDWSKHEIRDVAGRKGFFKMVHTEGSAGEYYVRREDEDDK